uniref:Uncharacterized protein n=1 Tax=Heterorhabditis bacteriophora TaxID=37862 RepID=A0A1I7WG30_HETBA
MPMPIHQNPNRKRVRPEQVGSKQADDFLSNLPSDTPNNFYHPFIDRHPWGHLVNS